MFDIGFWELVVIGVVALLVIGPERLPGVARTTGLWIGRLRRFVVSVKADVERELKAEELKRLLEEQNRRISQVHEIIEETRSEVEEAVTAAAQDIDTQTAMPAPDDTGTKDDGQKA